MIRRVAQLHRGAFFSMTKRGLATSDDFIVRPHTRGRPKVATPVPASAQTVQEAKETKAKPDQAAKDMAEREAAATAVAKANAEKEAREMKAMAEQKAKEIVEKEAAVAKAKADQVATELRHARINAEVKIILIILLF